MLDEPLDPIEVRVLGALIEKQFTTPENYPLTLNSLTAACNQTSNRDPVMKLDEDAVTRGLDDLARHKLARGVKRSDSRVLRYRHLMVESLNLHPPELAVLCVLLLRGAQTTGEIRTRTARMVEFIDLAHVDRTLESLMSLSPPLVTQLPRRPGQKEVRHAHLLSGPPPAEEDDEAAPDLPASGRLRDAGHGPDTAAGRIETLERTVAEVRAELAELRAELEQFRREFQ